MTWTITILNVRDKDCVCDWWLRISSWLCVHADGVVVVNVVDEAAVVVDATLDIEFERTVV